MTDPSNISPGWWPGKRSDDGSTANSTGIVGSRLTASDQRCFVLIEYGLGALFGLSIMAATVIPLGSEWLVAALVIKGVAPFSTVVVATSGNVIGSMSTYLLGRCGSRWMASRWRRIDTQKVATAREFYHRYGHWSLLLSWLPIIGDPLCLVAGGLRLPLLRFTLLVTLGKTARYGAVAAAAAMAAAQNHG
jgi:membrane protein YqaA with SNARE-associated domain